MKRWIATLMTVVMFLSAFPITAYAAMEPAAPRGPAAPKGSYGYYYDHLTDPLAKRVYEAIEKNRDHQEVTIDLPELEPYSAANKEELREAAGVLQPRIMQGAWCWRYDHILESDLYSNEIQCEFDIRDKMINNVVYQKTRRVTVKMPDHPYNEQYVNDEVEKLHKKNPLTALLILLGMVKPLEKQRDEAINRIVNEANKQTTVFAKLRSIHDQITQMGTYNYEALNWTEKDADKKEFFYAHSSLGILLNGTGVCESYAKIFKMVCDKMGLGECICLVSKTHMWNAVKIDGQWYAVDATWDDQASDKEPIHAYFLSGDPDQLDGIKTDHVVDTNYAVAPPCAAVPYRPLDSTVYMAAPTVTAANVNSGIELKWNAVDKAKKYHVMRAERVGEAWGDWTTLKSNLKSTSYIDKNTKNGVEYQYAVKAQNDFLASEIVPVDITRLTTPVGGVSNTSSGIKITWKANAAADGYYVYRAKYANGKWSALNVIATTKSASYVDKKVSAGADYRYAVRSFSGVSLSYYTISDTFRRLTAPKVSTENESKTITVSWKKVKGAAGYYVYRSEQKGKTWTSWKKVKTTKSVSYTDKKVTNGKKYRYNIRAYKGDVTGLNTTTTTITRLSPGSVKASKVSKGIKVTWSKNKAADGYYLYRREYKKGKWGKWVKLGNTKKTAYTDYKAKKKVNYQYSVKVVKGSSISVRATSKKVKR